MKLRSRISHDADPFDGLTAEDVRRIRGAAAVSVIPGLEGLAPKVVSPIRSSDVVPRGTKRGKR